MSRQRYPMEQNAARALEAETGETSLSRDLMHVDLTAQRGLTVERPGNVRSVADCRRWPLV